MFAGRHPCEAGRQHASWRLREGLSWLTRTRNAVRAAREAISSPTAPQSSRGRRWPKPAPHNSASGQAVSGIGLVLAHEQVASPSTEARPAARVDDLDGPVFSMRAKKERGHPMLPLYAARVSDLKSGDFAIVECASCGHDGLIHSAALPPFSYVLNPFINSR
jgi:hypothetical protein